MGVAIPTGGCLFATIVISGVQIPAGIMAGAMVIVGYLLVSKFHYPNFKEKSADPMNKSAIAAIIVIGIVAVFVNWHTVVFLPFALYIIFGIINSLINKIRV
jgi:CDP-diacylglycerol--serine O-phosphatidyltransferase